MLQLFQRILSKSLNKISNREIIYRISTKYNVLLMVQNLIPNFNLVIESYIAVITIFACGKIAIYRSIGTLWYMYMQPQQEQLFWDGKDPWIGQNSRPVGIPLHVGNSFRGGPYIDYIFHMWCFPCNFFKIFFSTSARRSSIWCYQTNLPVIQV